MPEFVNTNSHRIYLTADGESVRAGSGATFEAEGKLADKAQSTNGVVAAESQEAREYQGRALKPGEQQPEFSGEPGYSTARQAAVSDALSQARLAALSPNSDRYAGDPATGAVVPTAAGTPVPNQPTVPFSSTGAEVLGPGAGIIPAGPGGGQPAEGGPYEQDAIDAVEPGEGEGGPAPVKELPENPADSQAEQSDAGEQPAEEPPKARRGKATTSEDVPKPS